MPLLLINSEDQDDPKNPRPPRDYKYVFPSGGPPEQLPWLRKEQHATVANLCYLCSQIDFHFLFKYECPYRIELGTYREVKGRRCRFCDFIVDKSIRVPALRHRDYQDSDIVQIHSERLKPGPNDYVGLDDGDVETSKKLAVWINRDQAWGRSIKISAGFLNLHAYAISATRAASWKMPSIKGWARESRVVPPRYEAGVLTNWLHACCDVTGARLEGLGNDSVQRFIDVDFGCLAEAKDIAAHPKHLTRYAALSYVWGKQPQKLLLKKATYDKLHKPGALSCTLADLPRTVRHAMIVCRDIGVRYLWVDALCIVQDDQTKMDQINKMNRVYEDAFATIVAAFGEDADAGLCGVDDRSLTERQPTINIQGLAIFAEEADLDTVLGPSYWNKRAWTYQEYLLSPRRIVFTERMIYFSCSHGTNCEDRLTSEHATVATSSRSLNRSGYEIELYRGSNWRTYSELVSHYTTKKLTYHTDVVNAFKAITQTLSVSLFPDGGFACGVPISYLTAALLWRRCWGCELCDNTTRGLTKRGGFTDTTGPEGLPPSWSWAAWEGHVKYSTWLLGHTDPSQSLIPRVNWLTGPYLDCATLLISPNLKVGEWVKPAPLPVLSEPRCLATRQPQPRIEHFRGRYGRLSPGDLPIAQNEFLCLEADVARFPVVGRRFPDPNPRDVGDYEFDNGEWYTGVELGHPLVVYDPETKTQCGVVYDDVNMCDPGDPKWPRVPGSYIFVKLSQSILGKFDDMELSPTGSCHSKGWDEIVPGPGKDHLQHVQRSKKKDFRGFFDYEAWDCRKWCVYNVLMVLFKEKTAFRVGVGKIHVDAFDNAPSFERRTLYLG
ncbi:HET-domain-containing protein [Thozetella sp. PMI_491]|nr:HET-domain-containing protein [Thozetella sp. PMI_491]